MNTSGRLIIVNEQLLVEGPLKAFNWATAEDEFWHWCEDKLYRLVCHSQPPPGSRVPELPPLTLAEAVAWTMGLHRGLHPGLSAG